MHLNLSLALGLIVWAFGVAAVLTNEMPNTGALFMGIGVFFVLFESLICTLEYFDTINASKYSVDYQSTTIGYHHDD